MSIELDLVNDRVDVTTTNNIFLHMSLRGSLQAANTLKHKTVHFLFFQLGTSLLYCLHMHVYLPLGTSHRSKQYSTVSKTFMVWFFQ